VRRKIGTVRERKPLSEVLSRGGSPGRASSISKATVTSLNGRKTQPGTKGAPEIGENSVSHGTSKTMGAQGQAELSEVGPAKIKRGDLSSSSGDWGKLGENYETGKKAAKWDGRVDQKTYGLERSRTGTEAWGAEKKFTKIAMLEHPEGGMAWG